MRTREKIRVLLVEDSPSDVLLIRAALGQNDIAEFEMTSVARLAEAEEQLNKVDFDIVLLDLGLPDSKGIETFVRFRETSETVPVLVVTSLKDDELGTRAVRLGAEDYLIKDEIHNQLLGRVLRYAVERHRLQIRLNEQREAENRERELHDISQISGPLPTSVTADLYDAVPLSQSAPEEYQEAITRYVELLEQALEQRAFKTAHPIGPSLQLLGQHLVLLHAGPRDVVDVHLSGLQKKMAGVSHRKAQAYLEEGRLMALELMGYIAGNYRRRALNRP